MRQAHTEIAVQTRGQGLYEVTADVRAWVRETTRGDGLLTVFCRHTSASLLIQENADPDVLGDLQAFFRRIAPEDPARYAHGTEGPDDMPAHIRAALTQTQLSIPVRGGKPALGTWQGLYLYEHRARPETRRLVLHLIFD